MSGSVDIELYAPTAPTGSPKRLSSPAAAYDRGTQTCNGTYCHSSGQAAPTFASSPGWTSGAKLGCAGCHTNPPRYASGGAGTATANSHLDLADDGWEWGHFLGLAGAWHSSQHGRADAGVDASPITCQTCHADTTDPASAGPSGFYWLDTSGEYQLPGGDAARFGTGWYDRLRCTTCHGGANPAAPIATGKVLPLRHVNGARDVALDTRGSLGDLAWLPATPNRPVAPYWMTNATPVAPWPSSVVWSGSTVSFGLSGASYDPGTKTCSGVECHLRETPTWGQRLGQSRCTSCHPMKF
jgi:predicted CxxxxCH...CXXCH cytochrome family protein